MKPNGFLAKLVNFVERDEFRVENYTLEGQKKTPISMDSPENRWLSANQGREQTVRTRFNHWFGERGLEIFTTLYRFMSVIICVTLVSVLLSVVSALPPFGNPTNPDVNEVVERYVSKGTEETGAVNAVAGMISAYRGFDTLGEAHVLFVAACSVIVLLRVDPEERKHGTLLDFPETGEDMDFEPNGDEILRKTAKLLVPLSFIFGMYVILNGASSPGGGFSGGSLIGAGLILNSAAFGFRRTERFFGDEMYHLVKTACLTAYAAMMAYFIFMGANQLPDHVWLGIPGTIFSGGLILPINFVVGLEVACTMYCFYALFRKGGL